MKSGTFRAIVLRNADGTLTAEAEQLTMDDLPEGDVLVRILYSCLNYKDGLAVTGKGKIVQAFPFVPGIDYAGVVEESRSAAFQPGDQVVLTGWGVGERHWGGFAQYAKAKADWLQPLPSCLSAKQAMAAGTAGLTAMLCVMELERNGLKPGDPVAVTGAAGGVGSFAVRLLSELGCKVTASTGRPELEDYLRSLGAAGVIGRSDLAAPTKPLEKQLWKSAVDTVGGTTLGGLLSRMVYGGAVAACGLAGGAEWTGTVYPFILRGIKLLGVDSVYAPAGLRREAWKRLAHLMPSGEYETISSEIRLADVPEYAGRIMEGQVRGRILVNVNE